MKSGRRAVETPFQDDPIRTAVWMYYGEGRTQSEVAQSLGVSRTTAVNYLAEGRRSGLVSVELASDLISQFDSARELAARHALDAVHVVPGDTPLRPSHELLPRLGRSSARLMLPLLREGLRLGVAWGRTVLALAQALPERPTPGLRVIQLAGSSNANSHQSPEYCTSLIAARLGGLAENFHAPAHVSSPALREMLLREPAIQRQFEAIRRCDIALFGVASLERQFFYDEPQRRHYIDRDGCGLMVGRVVDAAGEPVPGPLDGHQISTSLADFAHIPMRVCIAGGADKIGAIAAVLRGTHATHLITDQASARALLEST